MTDTRLASAPRVLALGWPHLRVRDVTPLGHGLINDTFAVDAADARYVLQRVHAVFAPEIHFNIAAVTERLAARGMLTPRLVPPVDGDRPWHASDDGVWRLMTRIEGATFDVADPPRAHAAARLLARFHSVLHGIEHAFVGLRTGVHDTALHLRRLDDAVATRPDHRLHAEVAALADAIARRAEALPAITGLPDRIVHGDPKINNVLFSEGEAVCLIDLDTVGPMPLALELGDAWRSWCNPSGEDATEARFDLEIFAAALAGYAQGCTLTLDPGERAALVHGVEWITLELSARFAADALLESYFGWDRARFPAAGEHNLVRAQGQWSLHDRVVATRSERAALLAAAWS